MVKNLLDELSPEELAKIKAHQAETESLFKVDDYWLLIAEFNRVYGWEGYKAFRNDELTLTEMMTLIEAERKLRYREMFENAQTAFIASGSAQSRKPAQTFNNLTKNIAKKTKADEE